MSRKHSDRPHCVTQAWGGKPAPVPQGRCEQTITERNEQGRLVARVCGKKAKRQLCKSCQEKADAVQRTVRYVNPYREIWGSKA